MEITINPFEDRSSPVFCICNQISRSMYLDLSDTLHVDLTKVSFLQISTLALISLLLNKAASIGKPYKGKVIENSDLFRYMSRMNFFEGRENHFEEHFTRHPANSRFLEISPILADENNNELPHKLRDIVKRQAGISESLISALDYAFGELIDNVENHARGEVRGLVAAQYYEKGRYVEFCVADDGIGIVGSLRQNISYRNFDGNDLLLKAFEEGVGERVGSSFTGEKGHGCGFGLTFLARLVEATSGTLWVASHDYAATISTSGRHAKTDIYFPGTVICARIPSESTVTMHDLYGNGADEHFSCALDEIYGDTDSIENDILW